MRISVGVDEKSNEIQQLTMYLVFLSRPKKARISIGTIIMTEVTNNQS